MNPRAVLLLLLLVPPALVAAQDAVPIVTVGESVDAALSGGNDMKILQGNLDLTRAQYAGAVSKNSLTLAASGSYGAVTAFGNTTVLGPASSGIAAGTVAQSDQLGLTLAGPMTNVALTASPYVAPRGAAQPTSSVGLAVSQTLWNGYPGGVGKAAVDKGLIGLQGKELSTESGKLALVYKVKQAYYTMLAAQRALTLKKNTLDRYAAILAQISAVYDLKQASTIDLRTAQYNVRSAQIDVESAQRDLRVARVALANTAGWPADRQFAVAETEDPKVTAATVEDAVADGLGRRVEIKQLGLNRKSTAIDLAIARGQATPTVSVTGGGTAAVDWSGTLGATATAGLRIAIPILDAGSVKSQLDAVAAQNAVSAAQDDQLRRSITSDIQAAWENVRIQNERIELAGLAAETNDLQFQIAKTQLDGGTASNQDLMTASVNQANAQTALVSARSAAQLAVLQLQSVMGY